MAFRDILLVLDAAAEPAPEAAIGDAVALARRLGAGLSALAPALVLARTSGVVGDLLFDVSKTVMEEAGKSLAAAEAALAAFEAAARAGDVFRERILERCAQAELHEALVAQARNRDLTVLPIRRGQAGGLAAQSRLAAAEALVFGSGRPTLLLPDEPDRVGARAMNRVAIATDFSRAAARAVADALPLLESAEVVAVIVASPEGGETFAPLAQALRRNLAAHGVEAALDIVEAGGRDVADALQAQVKARRADVLVMGAYGHSRLREATFGGVTRSMLETAGTPLFLSR